MAMLGKRRPPRPASGHSGLARIPGGKAPVQGDAAAPLVIERLAHDGRGVSHDAMGKTVFVDQALPGERVEVGVHVTRKRFDEAHIKTRLSSSALRVTPPCAHFAQCGGCNLQHLEINAQRSHKRDVVTALMARQGIELGAITALNGSQENYRRRARLGVKVDGQGKVMLGFRAPHSHRLVDITQCHVLVPELQALIMPLRQLLTALEAPRLVGHIELLATTDTTVVLVRQLKHHAQDSARWQAFAEAQQVALGAWLGRETPALHWFSAAPQLYETLELKALGIGQAIFSAGTNAKATLTLQFSPGDFLQVNGEVNQKMVAQVVAWLTPEPGQQLLDLFAGIGNFSLPLAAAGTHVHAVEGNPAMVERIIANASHNHLDVSAQQADLSNTETVYALLQERSPLDALVLDPPRSGAEAICQAIGRYKIPRVVYISCDPATLARDAAHLMHAGYRVKQVAVADMFLHTAHMETLMLFEHGG
ncbi:23S rRNA (uracil(1939)-C(5))-methyltransferase RlmD [Vreelandella olivaria]|uniref:23S rRNA (uracil(1939)-C(5))-methyltransferase RlmD n=1 Tax=Vreelandella olivaria TaxID=390919 RepID=UPI00201EB237|nr:23S rRNA (uracil(1939)-C(5))-methyltransferase RlmD [Halomonas olivaria]